MLVPKRKNRPPSVDKSTQTTNVYKSKPKNTETSFYLETDDAKSGIDEQQLVAEVISPSESSEKSDHVTCDEGEHSKGVDNPIIVIEAV